MSDIGVNALKLSGGSISSNNGLILGSGNQLTSKWKIPVTTKITGFIKLTPSSSSILGGNVIMLDNLTIYVSKDSCYMKNAGQQSISFSPIKDQENIIAFSLDTIAGVGKIYNNGLLKESKQYDSVDINTTSIFYMKANDLIIHNIVFYNEILDDSQVQTITKELEVL